MLVSSIARFQSTGQRSVSRYTAWVIALEQMRHDWQSGACCEPREICCYLRAVPEDHKVEAAQDLIAEHLTLAWRSGTGKLLECYLKALSSEIPALSVVDNLSVHLFEDEFLARYQEPAGDSPTPAEYHMRFATRSDVRRLLDARMLDGQRYTKLRLLGRGGMGDVFEAYDRRLQRRVAIKQPVAGATGNVEALHRFAREARLTARLEHPGIVGLHEFNTLDQPCPFYVMRLVEGATFGEAIREYYSRSDRRTSASRLAWRQLLCAFVSVCDAMAYAHSRGVLHRDLTPANVIVGPGGETSVLDWGSATTIENSTDESTERAHLIIGTPEYMPPEQANGMAQIESDVFGLGAILYELLTGRAPYVWPDGTRPMDWRETVSNAQILTPRHYRADVSPELEAICLKAMASDIELRYRTVIDLATDVRCFLANERLVGCPDTIPRMLRRWLRRVSGSQ